MWQQLADAQLLTADELLALQSEYEGEQQEHPSPMPLEQWLLQQNVLTEYQLAVVKGTLQEPLRFGGYRLTERMTTGRLQGIYRGEHHSIRFPVCLRLVQPSGSEAERAQQMAAFEREARVLVQLEHPHIVRTFQIGKTDDTYFVASEDLRGQSLAELLVDEHFVATGNCGFGDEMWTENTREKRLHNLYRLMREAALGIAHLHEREIVHGALSLDNYWVTEQGRLRLLEFTLARDSLSFLDPPELQESRPGSANAETIADDLRAFGYSFYQALIGEALSDTEDSHEIIKPTQANPLIDSTMDSLLLDLIKPQQTSQQPSASEVAATIEGILNAYDGVLDFEQPSSEQLQEFLEWIQTDHDTLFGSSPGV